MAKQVYRNGKLLTVSDDEWRKTIAANRAKAARIEKAEKAARKAKKAAEAKKARQEAAAKKAKQAGAKRSGWF